MRVEDALGVLFWCSLTLLGLVHCYAAGVPAKALRSALSEAWLLIVCLIFLAWVVGMLSAGEQAAIGNSIAMTLWCLNGFLMWATRRWKGEVARQNPPIK